MSSSVWTELGEGEGEGEGTDKAAQAAKGQPPESATVSVPDLSMFQ
jgi:hypothetical protein